MDRNGVVHDVRQEFGYTGTGHIHPHYTPEWARRQGITNPNIVGMEIIARSERDVTPEQVESARRFVQEHYGTTPVYGHGEVNPGHRDADEGMRAVAAIRRERAGEGVATTRQQDANVTRPTPPQAPAAPARREPTPGRGTMLFLHGMQSRYGGTSPAQIEAQARRYAEARNMNLEVIDVSGDEHRRQQAIAQARINRGGVSAVLGFSAGGYTSQRLTGVQERIAVGAPGVPYNVRLPGRHMEQVEVLARQQESAVSQSTFASTTPARHD
jgi:hypothetical protein